MTNGVVWGTRPGGDRAHEQICPYCERKGFVRFEHVIMKGVVVQHFYCGACLRTWHREHPRDIAADRPARDPENT